MSSQFATDYTQANLSKDASAYRIDIFAAWLHRIQRCTGADTGLACAVLSGMLCAQRRGDAVGPLFRDFGAHKSNEEVEKVFDYFREAVILAIPFVGLPATMPAVFGMVSELKALNIDEIPVKQPRKTFLEEDWQSKGRATNAAIYRGVGNKEVGMMVNQYFPEAGYLANTAFFGYALGGSTVLSLKEVELVVASTIIASGATRQARSHTKAAMQLGHSVQVMQKVVEVAKEMADWSNSPMPEVIEVAPLKIELDAELAKQA